ncbi:MAG: Thiol-disulfide oxidoreductase ResA [Candidatus Omnitrophica bacterium]|nr:Thiol-disulfide oxidoreductase ResA [Candidatus Omnitrophota bacterium]
MNRLRRGAWVLTWCAVFGLMGCGETAAKTTTLSGTLAEKHQFTLEDLSGGQVALKDVLGSHKAVLINFWATWCPPCREEIPDLIRLQTQYKDKGFTVLGVDIGESARKVGGFAERNGLNYPIVLDKTMKVAESYGVVGIPTSYLIGSDGKVLGEYHAAGPDLFADVERVLAEAPDPAPPAPKTEVEFL